MLSKNRLSLFKGLKKTNDVGRDKRRFFCKCITASLDGFRTGGEHCMKYLPLMASLLIIAACGVIPEKYRREQNRYDSSGSRELEESGEITLRFLNVGEGDSTLIRTSSGKNILIDAGTKEMGRKRVLPAVIEDGGKLELIIASHHDADHIGGIPEVVKGKDGIAGTEDDIIPSIGILDRGGLESISTTALSDYLISASPHIFTMRTGESFQIDEIKFTILYQNGEYLDGTTADIKDGNENALGISLLISIGEVKYLSSGDIPGPNFPNQFEPYDIEYHIGEIAGPVDILHVSHHGSANSTSKAFLDLITPEYAIISVGDNSYGHPADIVLKNLSEAGSKIYLTDGGDICLETNGKEIDIGYCID